MGKDNGSDEWIESCFLSFDLVEAFINEQSTKVYVSLSLCALAECYFINDK